MSNETAPRRYRLGLPFWVWVLVLAGGAIGVVQGTDLMPESAAANIFSMLTGALAAVLLFIYFLFFSGFSIRTRLAGMIVVLGLAATAVSVVRPEGFTGSMQPKWSYRFQPSAEDRLSALPKENQAADVSKTTPNDFPGFLGPKRNGMIENVRLGQDWSTPPKELWKQPIGPGWSGFSIVNGYAVTMEQRGSQELVTCYELATGKLVWSHGLEARHEQIPGGLGPRSTPSIHEGLVYAMGATGVLRCLNGNTGDLVWQKDFATEYGFTPADEAAMLAWGRSASPLIVEEKIIVPVGGPDPGRAVTMVAYDKKTGKKIWEVGNYNLSYSSPSLAKLHGIPQVMLVTENKVVSHDLKSGQFLWEFDWPGNSKQDANVSQVIDLGDNRVFLTKGYGSGACLMAIEKADDKWTPKKIYQNKTVMRTKHTNVVFDKGYVFALSDGVLECIELETGKRKWKEGRYGHGQILKVGDLLLVLGEDGDLALVELSVEHPNHVLGQFKAIEGICWNNPALFGNRLLIRSNREAACYELPLAANSAVTQR